jgi:secernin
MCDTFVALGNATRDGSVIFGKNSDREPNEAHELVIVPHAEHPEGAEVQCTYISIPQARETNAVLLSKPFWIWGAEMGANEHGVVIGNEAVFTKVPYDKEPGLIGMDMLRLALERASTASEALEVLIELLETFGQGGNCGCFHPLYYHNGFLVADPTEAWILETAGREWAAEKVRDVRSISNVISIGSHWDRVSDGLVSHAVEKRWCKKPEEFHFGRCYSDLIFSTFCAGRYRLHRSDELLKQNLGEIDLTFGMGLLRDHGPDADQGWLPGKGIAGAELCMHASAGPIRISQTTGSMVSRLTPEGATHWMTGTAAPCTSTFKPVWIDSGLPDLGPLPTGTYNEAALWWRHEDLHREILKDYPTRIETIKAERDALELNFLGICPDTGSTSAAQRLKFTSDCFAAVDEVEKRWLAQVRDLLVQHSRPLLDKLAWQGFNKHAERE